MATKHLDLQQAELVDQLMDLVHLRGVYTAQGEFNKVSEVEAEANIILARLGCLTRF